MLLIPPFAFPQTAKDHDEFEFTRQQLVRTQPYIPRSGMVPDSATAIAIAYAVGIPAYGKKLMDEERPFRAELQDGTWSVLGSLHCSSCDGGTIFVQIDKTTGRIVRLNHLQ